MAARASVPTFILFILFNYNLQARFPTSKRETNQCLKRKHNRERERDKMISKVNKNESLK